MAIPAPAARPRGAGRDGEYHSLTVRRLIRETADSISVVLDVPEHLTAVFKYAAGQFCTFRVSIGEQVLFRCYSMSSSPDVDKEMQVTIKRVPGGPVSNWMNDVLASGDRLDVSPPAGLFQLDGRDGDIVAFGAGSGITPIFSIIKTALATTTRRVRLLYANRDRESVIFAAELASLMDRHADRFTVVHHLDSDHGYVGSTALHPLIGANPADHFFVCGPGPFMDMVETALMACDVSPDRIRIERFTTTVSEPVPEATPERTSGDVTITLNGRQATAQHRPGTTILQTARELGMSPPFSCESGNCATCMAKLIAGDVAMRTNNALTPDEVADGWILTCQAVPTPPSVHVVYE